MLKGIGNFVSVCFKWAVLTEFKFMNCEIWIWVVNNEFGLPSPFFNVVDNNNGFLTTPALFALVFATKSGGWKFSAELKRVLYAIEVYL